MQNLPFGVFNAEDGSRIAVAIGDKALDIHAAAESGLFDGVCAREMLQAPLLNPLLAAGRPAWRALRARLSTLLRVDGDPALRSLDTQRLLLDRNALTMRVPMQIGDYVDFYSSLEHATNLGRLFRPNAEPLLPNWRWLPVGYHGRAGTIVTSGTPIRRPSGQRKAPADEAPQFGPSRRLDIELEMGFITGPANALGSPIPVGTTGEHIFGMVLVNDWSARDIQAWEYQPLGPFLGKSFATTVSPWIVTMDALAPFAVDGPAQDPAPLEYLQEEEPRSYAIALEVQLQTQKMREKGVAPQTISHANFDRMYWSVAQQLAHATVNGAVAAPGDLFASGTISGDSPGTQGSFIELSWNGERPLQLANGETRAFLEDGDEITLRGSCERPSARRIGFGSAQGRIVEKSTTCNAAPLSSIDPNLRKRPTKPN